MEIAKDTFVVMDYTLAVSDGTLIKGENGPASMNFFAGYGQVMPALERRLYGMEEGEEKEFVIPAAEAFGERQAGLVKTRTFDEFPQGRELEPGRWVVAKNERTGAGYSYFVKEKHDDRVVLDHNHPLAGEDLYYKVKIVRVREATERERLDLRPCEAKGGPDEALQ